MIPRAPQCDDDRCDYDETGRWVHNPGCPTQTAAWGAEDMALTEARVDGYSHTYARRPYSTTAPRQRNGEAA